MAIINKTGITDGGTIQAEHVTRAIDALSGVSTDSIVATGSFTGSFKGTFTGIASQAATISTSNNAAEDTNYYILTTDSSTGYALTYTDSNLRFNPSTNALTLTGSLTTSGSLNMIATPASNVNFSAISSSGQFAIPITEPTSPTAGAMYLHIPTSQLYVWDGTQWLTFSPA
jgi:hypothetical protein